MTKIILITGASKGIGRITAQYLHSKGYKVYGTSRHPSQSEEYEMLVLDVTDNESVATCVTELIEREGRIDVLINNAGFGVIGGMADATVEDMHWQFDTNLFGIHRMVRAVLPYMKEQEKGMIINIGSFGGRLAVPYQGLYSASKAAVAIYSDALRMEVMRDNIIVTCIEPGDTKTDFDAGRVEATDYSAEDQHIAESALNIMREAEKKGADPMGIATRIEKIIKKEKAKPRYTTGMDAKVVGFLQRLLPYSLQERGIMMNYKVPRKQ